MRHSLSLVTVTLLGLALAGCGSGKGSITGADAAAGRDGGMSPDVGTKPDGGPGPDGSPDGGVVSDVAPPTFAVDPGMAPVAAGIAGLDGQGADRPLGRLESPRGAALDFTLSELVVASDDRAAVDALAARWGGSVLKEIALADAHLTGIPRTFLVKVDPSRADVSKLPGNLQKLAPGATGASKVSNQAALQLLAIAAAEAGQPGLTVGLNPLFEGQAAADGFTKEALAGDMGFVSDACAWPYMNKGSQQDFGVCAAWQLLAQQGKFGNKVKVLVMDGGFLPIADLPPGTRIFPPNSFNKKNPDPSDCNGAHCPWHGTWSSTTMAAVPDNAFGIAGPAGPVADLMLVQSPSLDFFQIVTYAVSAIAALGESPKVVNISATVKVPWEWGWAVKVIDLVIGAFRGGGTLVVAAAGNSGEDVDTHYAPFNNEDTIYMPCELDQVLCVGGLAWDSIQRHTGSDFGKDQRRRQLGLDDPKRQDSSVDLYGPYTVWAIAVDDNGPKMTDMPTKKDGTSLASPFVAGIAALLWAANPGLSADDVFAILIDTAKATPALAGVSDGLRVDAFAAVKKALGIANVPPVLKLVKPMQNDSFDVGSPLGVTFEAQVSDIEDGGACCKVTWSSLKDGPLGEGKSINVLFKDVGTRLITVMAEDSQGGTTSMNVAIAITNAGPTARILKPTAGQQFAIGLGYNMALEAQTWIANPNVTYAYTWTSSVPSDNFPKTGAKPTNVVFGSLGTRTLTLTVADNLGGQQQATVNVEVVDKGINFLAPTAEAQIAPLLSGSNLFINIEVKPAAPQGRVVKLVWKGDTAGCNEEPVTLSWNIQVVPPPGTKDVWGEWNTSTASTACFGIGKHGTLRLYVTDPNAETQMKDVHLNWTPPPT